jgi:hypothetical protein
LNNTKQTNSGAQLLYPYVRYLPNAHKELVITTKGKPGPDGRWLDLGNGFGLHLGDANKVTAMGAHKKLDTPMKVAKAKKALSLFFKGHSGYGGLGGGHGAKTKAGLRNQEWSSKSERQEPPYW